VGSSKDTSARRGLEKLVLLPACSGFNQHSLKILISLFLSILHQCYHFFLSGYQKQSRLRWACLGVLP
jgi:hypothetical protein